MWILGGAFDGDLQRTEPRRFLHVDRRMLLELLAAWSESQRDGDFAVWRNYKRQIIEFRTETQLRASANRGAENSQGHMRRIT